MQFYKLVGLFAVGSGGQGRKRTADEKSDLLAAKSEAFNKGLRGRAFFYVVNASGGTFTAMAVQKDPRMNMNPQFPAYTEVLGVKLTDIHAEEISLHAACNLLHRARRNDYIEDDDDVLEALDLGYMVRRFGDFCFREDLMAEASRNEIYAKAGRLFTKDCLLPELDRIYAGGSFGKIVGHPVHYLIQTDDAGIRREMIQALLPSLYANGRLQNRRYSAVRFRGEALHGESSAYDQFYKSNAGGTVIVQYSADYGDIGDEDTADGIRDTIEKLCSYIKKYRHQVLTILCLPRECTKLQKQRWRRGGSSIATLTAPKRGMQWNSRAQKKWPLFLGWHGGRRTLAMAAMSAISLVSLIPIGGTYERQGHSEYSDRVPEGIQSRDPHLSGKEHRHFDL